MTDKLCKDCEYFHIRQQPLDHWDSGLAECQKYGLVVDFNSTQKINRLTCVVIQGGREESNETD